MNSGITFCKLLPSSVITFYAFNLCLFLLHALQNITEPTNILLRKLNCILMHYMLLIGFNNFELTTSTA